MHALVRMALRMRLLHQQQGSVERPLPVIRYLTYEPRARGVNANAVRYPHGGGEHQERCGGGRGGPAATLIVTRSALAPGTILVGRALLLR
ncbi:hypothetical protein B0H14DRAFT_3449733 [Mycena olivaceomarginata]|nr:hypothetical protein B0H14DRAFT_3449733 [Mycena olivaceomarginata]